MNLQLAALTAVQSWNDAPSAIAAVSAFVRSSDYEDSVSQAAGLAAMEQLSTTLLGLYRAFPEEGRTAFSIATLAVPPLFASWGFVPADRDGWAALVRPAEGIVPLLHRLIVEGVIEDVDTALAHFIEDVCTDGFEERLKTANLSARQLGHALDQAGWFVASSPVLKSTIGRVLARHEHSANAYVAAGRFLADVLNFYPTADDHWLDCVAQECLIPQIAAAAHQPQLADHALAVESLIYMVLLKKIDTAENWKRTYETMAPALAAAGRRFGATYYSGRPIQQLPADVSPPRIAFFLWGDFSTAHAQMVYVFLRGLAQIQQRPVEPLIYVLEGPGKNLDFLKQAVSGLGAIIRHPPTAKNFSITTIDWLRACAQEDRISAMVFVSVPLMMSFAAGVRIAPVHVYWSLKYHSLNIPEIEGYLATALLQHRPASFGPHWRIGDAAIPFRFDRSLTAEANAIRARFGAPHTVILGCLGRADKLRDPTYVALLGRLMRSHPNTVFLWTGRSEPPDLLDLLRAEGIGDRCHFVGWVNVRLYAQVLDIKIDSFPFASGHTCVETMAAGRPVVTLLTPESRESSTATSFMPLWEGRIGAPSDHAAIRAMFTDTNGGTFAPFFETIESYEAFADRLITEPSFRNRVGSACRQFVETFLGDEKRMAATTADQLRAMIEEKRKSEI